MSSIVLNAGQRTTLASVACEHAAASGGPADRWVGAGGFDSAWSTAPAGIQSTGTRNNVRSDTANYRWALPLRIVCTTSSKRPIPVQPVAALPYRPWPRRSHFRQCRQTSPVTVLSLNWAQVPAWTPAAVAAMPEALPPCSRSGCRFGSAVMGTG
jgi:hypothetical protein